MTNMTLNVHLPRIVLADDYHEFAAHGTLTTLVKSFDSRLKLEHVGFVGSKYLGVVYKGRKPSRAKVLELIKAHFGKYFGDLYVEVEGKQYLPAKDKWTFA